MRKRESYVCRDHGYLDPVKVGEGAFSFFKACSECSVEQERQRAEEEKAKETAERNRRITATMQSLAIGRRYRGMTFDDYEEVEEKASRVKRFCQRYSETFADRLKNGDSILMLGGCGTGKNMLAAIVCQEVVKQGYSAVHTSVVKMVRRVKESWSRETDETESKALAHFSMPDLLVVDEVGVQFGSDTERMYLTEIINDRYEAMRPTILISNLAAKDLEAVVGERVIDRFYEGKGGVITFSWPSYRRNASK